MKFAFVAMFQYIMFFIKNGKTMKFKFLVTVLSLSIIFIGCNKEELPELQELSPKTKELINSDNDFGFDLLQRINAETKPGENMCVSPLSVSLALAMTYNGADGDTEDAMKDALKLAGFTTDEINELYRDLTQALISDDPRVQLEIANSIWYRNDFIILDDFIERNEVYYDAKVDALDFADPGAKDIINDWVSDKTHKKIESIVDQISAQSFMFLINAIYFNGKWTYEFDKDDTQELSFYKEDGTISDVPTMRLEADLNMLQTEIFDAVQLPYGKGNIAMYVLLPNEIYRVNDVIEALNNESWAEYLDSFYEQEEVKLQLPKWKSEFEVTLNTMLMDMGMEVAFTDFADFSRILPGAPLKISKVKHKTFIEVNEEGTEAAAVTSVEINLTSISGKYFNVNKPFVYLIAEKNTGAVLFAGKVMDPLGD